MTGCWRHDCITLFSTLSIDIAINGTFFVNQFFFCDLISLLMFRKLITQQNPDFFHFVRKLCISGIEVYPLMFLKSNNLAYQMFFQ